MQRMEGGASGDSTAAKTVSNSSSCDSVTQHFNNINGNSHSENCGQHYKSCSNQPSSGHSDEPSRSANGFSKDGESNHISGQDNDLESGEDDVTSADTSVALHEGFIAVHVGAGRHSRLLHRRYRRLVGRACRHGTRLLREGASAMDAAEAAVALLEDSPLTNAGRGSSLTLAGRVEADASVMCGRTLRWAGVAAVPGVRNPVRVARKLADGLDADLPLGRIPPCLLVGVGARRWAKQHGLAIVPGKHLIAERSLKSYKKYKARLDMVSTRPAVGLAAGDRPPQDSELLIKSRALLQGKVQLKTSVILEENARLDTVGVVVLDKDGNVAAACSSGGIALKEPGRVGQAAIPGSGAWAENGEKEVGSGHGVAVTTTGCGEHLVRAGLAQRVAALVPPASCPTTALHQALQRHFIDSKFLRNVATPLGGVLYLQHSPSDGGGDLLWAHTTATMCVGYMGTSHQRPTATVSSLPRGTAPGRGVAVHGACFRTPPQSR